MAKKGHNVITGADGFLQLDSSGKVKLTNINGHCGECCNKPDPCQLQFCGPINDRWGPLGPSELIGPVTVQNLPYVNHFQGYEGYCDQHFKLLQDREEWYITDEVDVSWTSIEIECLTNGDTKFTSEIIYYDNSDPLLITWREWSRTTTRGAWPLYKMSPTFDQATNQLTVDIGWRRDPTQAEIFFNLYGAEGVANIAYTGSGTVKSTSTTALVLEDTEGGGTGQITVTLKPLQFDLFYMNLSKSLSWPYEQIQSVFRKQRSFKSYGSDSVTLSYSGDGNCLICSNYDLYDVELEIGDCTANYQIAATENVRPWYHCGVQNQQHEAHAELAYNNLMLREPERYDLQWYPLQTGTYVDRLGPGWPMTEDVWGTRRVPSDWGQQNGYLNTQEKNWMELTDALEFWILRSPRNHKSNLQMGPDGYRTSFTNDRWWETGLPPQDRTDVPQNNLPIHNSTFDPTPATGGPGRGVYKNTTRAAVKHPNRWPELNHPGGQARRFTSTATIDIFEPDPPMVIQDPWWGLAGIHEAQITVYLGCVTFEIFFYDVANGEDGEGLWYLYFYGQNNATIWGLLNGHVKNINPNVYKGPSPYGSHELEITADLPNVYDLGFSGIGTLPNQTYTNNITWNIKLGGEDLYTGRLLDNPDGLPINKTNQYVPDTYVYDSFLGMGYPGPPNCYDRQFGLDDSELLYQHYSKMVGYSFYGYSHDAGWAQIPPGQPDICPPDLINKATKISAVRNVEHKVEYV